MYNLLRFVQNRPLNLLFLSTFEKGQKMAKWSNHFISGKQLHKGQMATLVFSCFLIYLIKLVVLRSLKSIPEVVLLVRPCEGKGHSFVVSFIIDQIIEIQN